MRNIIVAILFFSNFVLDAQEKVNVVCSASMFADMTKNIGGEYVLVSTIVPIGGDPHIYEATPGDAQMVKKADLIFINGLTFEGWIEELVDNSGTKGEKYIITKGIKPISSNDYKNSYDPHAWMNAQYGIIYCKNIVDALTSFAPNHAEYFKANFDRYKKELEETDIYIKNQIKSIPKEKRILVTSHDAFNYYGQQYGLRLEAIQGISTDADVRTSDISRVTNIIKETGISSIFIESTINPKLIKQLATDNGVTIGGELFADSLGEEDGVAGTYIKMLKSNTDVIVKALAKQEIQETKIDGDNSMSSTYLYALLALIMAIVIAVVIKKLNK